MVSSPPKGAPPPKSAPEGNKLNVTSCPFTFDLFDGTDYDAFSSDANKHGNAHSCLKILTYKPHL